MPAAVVKGQCYEVQPEGQTTGKDVRSEMVVGMGWLGSSGGRAREFGSVQGTGSEGPASS